MLKIRLAYMNGGSIAGDYAKTFEWFQKAAQARHCDAIFNLGLMYYNGCGVEKDYEQAVK